MIDTATLLLRLNDKGQIAHVRMVIVDFMLMLLERHREVPDEWQMRYLVNAVDALSLNVHALHQPTSAWLRLCLDDLERAQATHIESEAERSTQREQLIYAQLREAIEAIATEIGHLPSGAE